MTHRYECSNCWKHEVCDQSQEDIEEFLCKDCIEDRALTKERAAKCDEALNRRIVKDTNRSFCELHQNGPILVWPFYEAPKELQDFSGNGGDEDWIAYIPKNIVAKYGDWIGWLETSSFDSMQEPQVYDLKSGARIVIGSHA